MYTLIVDPYSVSLRLFISLLNQQNIQHTYIYHDGDESTHFYDVVVFNFKSEEDWKTANDICDNC